MKAENVLLITTGEFVDDVTGFKILSMLGTSVCDQPIRLAETVGEKSAILSKFSSFRYNLM